MDIKDFILIGGGILIAAVVLHGFWIAYRARHEPYRLDIVPDLIPDDVDDIERLRGELPNGGARVRGTDSDYVERQTSFDLDEVVPAAEETPAQTAVEPEISPIRAVAHEPFELGTEDEINKARVADVSLVTPDRRGDSPAREESLHTDSPQAGDEPALNGNVEELLIFNVIAGQGRVFAGEDLVNAMRRQGLKYGEMNIFHRIEPTTKAKVFSIANIVEPGTFDLSDLETINSPGVTLFMQLPGPGDAMAAFEDMLNAGQQIALELGAEMRDEQMRVLTGQTKEHMRQRIADFARRKLSKRA